MSTTKRGFEFITRIVILCIFVVSTFAPVSAQGQSLVDSTVPETSTKGFKSSGVRLLVHFFSSREALQADETPTPEPVVEPSSTPENTPVHTEVIPTASVTPQATALPANSADTSTISVKFAADPEQATAGEQVVFSLTIVNNGESEIEEVSFSNTLPDMFDYVQSEGFEFDSNTRELTWSDPVGEPLLPGESLTAQYSVQITGELSDSQIVDTASFTASGLDEPIAAETTLTLLNPENSLTVVDSRGGEAIGLDGHVKVDLADQTLDTAAGLFIQDLSDQPELAAASDGQPWLVFELGLQLPQPQDAELLSPEIDEPAIQSFEAPALIDELFQAEATGKDEIALDETATPTPLPDIEESAPEMDRAIPFEEVEAEFEKPVEVTVSFDGLTDLATLNADLAPFLVTLDEVSGTWIRVPLKNVDREANSISAEVTHFSTWGAGIGPSFPQNGANVLLYDSAYPSLFTGRSSYSLPIWTPPGRNGMSPSLALSYSSGTVDGVLGDIQAPWVGMGWNIDSMEIARKITNGGCTPCGDGAYGYENKFILLFNGTGYELIPDGTTAGRYHTKSESHLYIQLHNNSLGNNSPAAANSTGEWWEVIEKNGTRWRLGWNSDSEQLANMSGYPGAATGGWSSLGYAGAATDVVASRWRVDQGTDTHGNRMTFNYFEEYRLVVGTSTNYDQANYLENISYTSHISGVPSAGYSVAFVRESRGGSEVPLPQTDWDNWDTNRLDRIEVKHGSTVVRTYDLSYDVQSYSDDSKSWETTVLSSVAISGGSTNAPSVTFAYTDKDNRANCGTGCQEWAYPRLASVSNGWGSSATYTYGNDGRPSTSWYNWRVTTLDIADGVNISPMKTTYAYTTACYKDAAAGWCNLSNVGELVGYGQTTATTKDFDGTTSLAINVHKYHTDQQKAGREYELQNQNGSGTILSQTNTTYTVATSGLPAGGYFIYASAVEKYLRTTSLVRVSRTEFTYNTLTGNLTNEKQYNGTPTLYRQTDYEYVTNTSASYWILGTLARTTLKDSTGTTISVKAYGYDGNLPATGSPTVGELTLSREVNGTQTIDTKYIYDTYGNLIETHLYKNYGTTASQPSGTYLIYSSSYDSVLKTYPVLSANPLSHTVYTDYDYDFGLPTLLTDANGNATSITYDGLGRITSTTHPGYALANVKYTYPTSSFTAPFALRLEVYDETISDYRSAWQIMDGLGRVIQTQSPYETAGELVLSDVSYNAQGKSYFEGLPRTISGSGGTYSVPSWGSIPHTTTNYDALGEITSVGYPDGSTQTYSYSGLRTNIIDRNNHQKTKEMDAFGRLVKVEEYTGSGTYTLYATTTYEYDTRDLTKKVIDSQGNQTIMGYNGFGRNDSIQDPNTGSWSYTYDVFGNLTSQSDARGCGTTITYDDINRPLQKMYTGPGACDSTPDVAYSYDSTTGGNEGIGHRTGMTDGSGLTTWTYNELGQTTTQSQTIDGTPYQLASTFDAFGRPLTQTLPSSEILNYSYNASGALSGLSGLTTYVSQIHYTPSGLVNDQVLGNNLLQQSCYSNNTLRLTNTRVYSGSLESCAADPSNPILNLKYASDSDGNITQVFDSIRQELSNYIYDEANRLTAVQGAYHETYTYNPVGNITTKSTAVIDPGDKFTCAITLTNGVQCWGHNGTGQLGNGTTVNSITPVDVNGLSTGAVNVVTGTSHACALTSSGGVKCWGDNWYGQLGNGTTASSSIPVDVIGLSSGVVSIAAGNGHNCAITTSGALYCWGFNGQGQLGDGSTTNRSTPVPVTGLANGVSMVAAGGTGHTCAIVNSIAKCWGYNGQGQLGDGTNTQRTTPTNVSSLSDVISLSTGYAHTCALVLGGSVKCWGMNSYGQLGDGTTTSTNAPVSVNGINAGATAIATGSYHSCSIVNSQAKCWGQNANATLGDGTVLNSSIPVVVSGLSSGVSMISGGNGHTCAIVNSMAKCWGAYANGQLGDGAIYWKTTPVDASSLTSGVSSVDGGENFSCAVTTSNTVKCWGINAYSQLGDGTTAWRNTPVSVIAFTGSISSVATGGSHACVLTTAGGVKCWGRNNYGQLGNGTTTNSTTPVDVSGLTSGVMAISAGVNHTCAITTSGGVKCWWRNSDGQLGDGSAVNRSSPVDTVGLTSGVSKVSAGSTHTCAVTTSGGAKCWGANLNGQLGNGTPSTREQTPVNVTGMTSGVTAISVGYSHTCAIKSGGAKCWGVNGFGALGDGTTTNRLTAVDVVSLTSGVTSISAAGAFTCAIVSNAAKCWGYNLGGQLGNGTTTNSTTPVSVTGMTSGVTNLAVGGIHTCAVKSGGVKCWGDNSYGQLGDGTGPGLVPVNVTGSWLNNYSYSDASHKHAVTSILTGENYSYDANGNMITRVEGGVSYTQVFDAENRLVSVTTSGQTTQFLYNGDGELVKKTYPNGSKTIYAANGRFEVEKSAGGSVIRNVTYYPGGGAMRIDSTVHYVITDHLGSASLVTDSSGDVVGEQRYYAYGATRFSSGSMFTDKLFTGQREMSGLGIYYYGSRFYSPTLGRFISADTIVPEYSNPQSLNRYSYVFNNPLRYNDPTGHIPADCYGTNYCGSTKSKLLPDFKKKDKGDDDDGTPAPVVEEAGWAPPLGDECGIQLRGGPCTGELVMYRAFTFGTVIPPIYPIGWHVTITQDRYGQNYIGGGLDVGKSLLFVSASLVDGYLNKDVLPEGSAERAAFMKEFITGSSKQAFIAPIAYVGGNGSFSMNIASLEIGGAIPSVGLGLTYTLADESP